MLLDSLDTNDTFNGFQGSSEPPVEMSAQTAEPAATVDMGTEPSWPAMVDVGTEPPPAPQPVTKVDVGTEPPRAATVDAGTEPAPAPPPVIKVNVGTEPMSSDAGIYAPKPKPAPKRLQAVNEAAQLVDPSKLVDWGKIMILPAKLESALLDLGNEPHIVARIPRFSAIYTAVMDRLRDPAILKAAAASNLTLAEAQALIACPMLR